MKLSSIDIGTNTLLIVIAEQQDNKQLNILHDIHSIARLGEGVDKTGIIKEEALERAVVIAQEYERICVQEGVTHKVAIATSAVRDATNGVAVCRKLSQVLGCEVRTISGDEEARLSFIGTSESLNKTTVIDIGGGSTEYVTGENNHIQHRMSLQIGAVRLHERYLKALPPPEENTLAARMEIRRQLGLLPQASAMHNDQFESGELIGVGGTFTTLAALDMGILEFDSASIHHHTMTAENISRITHELLTTPLPKLLENPAIHPKRADILPAGALILEETLRFFGATACKASTKGLRYGVLYDTLQQFSMGEQNSSIHS
jgi:exopolyphosphatase/guanosine-5'-triphosphate,3'-diphosphate pyrophosphatase